MNKESKRVVKLLISLDKVLSKTDSVKLLSCNNSSAAKENIGNVVDNILERIRYLGGEWTATKVKKGKATEYARIALGTKMHRKCACVYRSARSNDDEPRWAAFVYGTRIFPPVTHDGEYFIDDFQTLEEAQSACDYCLRGSGWVIL
jgi:hypothetical protein